MAETGKQRPRKERAARGKAGKIELGYYAHDNYKARLTKGLLGVGLGEGYIVEILNFRSKRVLRRELFEDAEQARDELARVRDDIDTLPTEDFRKKYLRVTSD